MRARLVSGKTLAFAAAVIFLFILFVPRITQDETYHVFADRRTIFGVPHFWNVVSNLPFALAGMLGLWKVRGLASQVLFAGVLLTCFGSGYYHLAPNDARLLWDRLPMTLAFMSLLTLVISEGRDPRFEPWILAALAACGVASVSWWRVTGDLRPYVLVQFVPVGLLLPVLYSGDRGRDLWPVFGLYVLAKLAELSDYAIYSHLPVSGHTIKHLCAALASGWMLRWCAKSDGALKGGLVARGGLPRFF